MQQRQVHVVCCWCRR